MRKHKIWNESIIWVVLTLNLFACSENKTGISNYTGPAQNLDSSYQTNRTNAGTQNSLDHELLNKSFNSDSLYCQSQLRLAQSYASNGNIDSAIIHWQRVIAVCPLPDVNSSNFLARQLVETGALEAATPVCKTAIKLAIETRDTIALIDAYQTASSLFHRKKELDSMRLCAQYAYDLSSATQSTAARSRALMTLAAYYTYTQAYPEAVRDMKHALLLSQDTNDSLTQLHSLFNLGVLFDRLDQPDSAKHFYEKALEIAKILQIPGKVSSLQYTLSYNLYDRGAFKKAFDVINEAVYLEDSLQQEAFGQALSELQVKYETAVKEQNITVLKAEQRKVLDQRNIAWLVAALTLLVFSSLAFFIYQKLTYNRRMTKERIRRLKQQQELSTLHKMVTAQETERRRIAQDLHDGLGALLSTARLKLGKVLADSEALNHQLLDSTREIVATAGTEVRRISHDMMPGVLMELGLVEGIWAFLEGAQTTEGPDIDFAHHALNGIHLSEETEIMLYRIVQELVTNSLKHAKATNISVAFNLSEDKAQLSMLYDDDGLGFNPSLWDQKDHIGLNSLKSRISIIRGSMIIDEDHISGFHIKIEFPIA